MDPKDARIEELEAELAGLRRTEAAAKYGMRVKEYAYKKELVGYDMLMPEDWAFHNPCMLNSCYTLHVAPEPCCTGFRVCEPRGCKFCVIGECAGYCKGFTCFPLGCDDCSHYVYTGRALRSRKKSIIDPWD